MWPFLRIIFLQPVNCSSVAFVFFIGAVALGRQSIALHCILRSRNRRQFLEVKQSEGDDSLGHAVRIGCEGIGHLAFGNTERSVRRENVLCGSPTYTTAASLLAQSLGCYTALRPRSEGEHFTLFENIDNAFCAVYGRSTVTTVTALSSLELYSVTSKRQRSKAKDTVVCLQRCLK